MKYYLIDYENTGAGGFAGCSKLGKEETIIIFFTKNANKIDMSVIANHGSAQLQMIEIPAGKQSADIHIGSYVGYLAAENKGQIFEIAVISKDRDFDNMLKFWRERTGMKLYRSPQIKAPAVPESASAAKEKTPAAPATSSAAKEKIPAAPAAAPAVKEKIPAAPEAAPEAKEKTPAASAAAPEAKEKTPAAPAAAPAEKEMTPAAPEAVPAAKEKTPAAPAAKKKAPAASGKASKAKTDPAVTSETAAALNEKKEKNGKTCDKAEKTENAPAAEPKKESAGQGESGVTLLNNNIMKTLSKAGFASEIVGFTASLVSKNYGVKNAKQQIYRTIISRFGQKDGLEIYSQIKKMI